MGLLKDSFNIALRDIRIESRRPYEILSTIFFAASTGIMASIAWGTPISITTEESVASLWIIIFFASILLFTTSFAREIDRGTIGGLKTMPSSPSAILIGKFIYSFIMMLLVILALVPLSTAFLNISLASFLDLLPILLVGAVDISFAGSFISSIVMYSEGKTLLLPFLLFPVTMPIFVPALLSSEKILRGLSFIDYSSELRLMGGFFIIVVLISMFTFETILEE